jgi:UDP-N-acetylmuramoyl-tripeptide--D-alanyl-D-alanine ligase
MRRLAVATTGIALICGATAAWLSSRISLSPAVGAVLAVIAFPLLTDGALWLTEMWERRLGRGWIEHAEERLARVLPRVVAITGSYGKTTTKEYVRLLLSTRWSTVASPASFNNAMGLARTVNEHLAAGTEVFVAEMGTYGPGEIAALCRWIPPDVSVITAIGPVHLERFGSVERTLEAKSEILQGARVAVLNVDDPRLAGLADEQPAERSIIRCSAVDRTADVAVVEGENGQEVLVAGERIAVLERPVAFPTNAACAVGAALAMDVDRLLIGGALDGAERPAHRQTVYRSELGFTVVDDTYNANPAGAEAALKLLAEVAPEGRRVVVTPGMVELGPIQDEENEEFGRLAAAAADEVIIVGRTNRAALLRGASGGPASVMVVASRTEAVDWVRLNLDAGDGVLYENDLPDHYP